MVTDWAGHSFPKTLTTRLGNQEFAVGPCIRSESARFRKKIVWSIEKQIAIRVLGPASAMSIHEYGEDAEMS
jgi:hypothetical protein